MIAELRPVFETLPPSAMRMELTRLVSGRPGLSEGLAETLLASGGQPRAGERSARNSESTGRTGRAPHDGTDSGANDGKGGKRWQKTEVRARTGCFPPVRTPSARFWRCVSRHLSTASPRSEKSSWTGCSPAI